MKNKLLIGLGIIAIMLLVWVFLTPDKTKARVRICFPPHLIATMPHWVAIENNYYGDEGIEPVEIPLADSKAMISSLYSDDADFLPAVSLADFILTASDYEKSLPPIVISHSRMRRNPDFEALIVANGSEISRLTDLEGKRIAVYPGITSLLYNQIFLKIKRG